MGDILEIGRKKVFGLPNQTDYVFILLPAGPDIAADE